VPRLKKLSHLQLMAISHYFNNGGNQTQAMLSAGYSELSSRRRQGSCFDHPLVVAEIERRRKLLTDKHELTTQWVIDRLMQQADAGRILAPFKEVQEDGTIAWNFTNASDKELEVITEIAVDFYTEKVGEEVHTVKKFKVKVPDAQAALNALARHLGMFNDKLEITGSLAERLQAGRQRALDKRNESSGDTVH
jgi:phage terminase small subunit